MSEPETEKDDILKDEKDGLTEPIKSEKPARKRKPRPVNEPRIQHRDPQLITR